jgi:hypothetical protein
MPQSLDKCVSDISGTNKRTGKPYTTSEKYAICKSALKNRKATLTEEDFQISQEIMDDVGNKMHECAQKMMKSGKARNENEAKMLCESLLARANFEIDQLYLVLSKV